MINKKNEKLLCACVLDFFKGPIKVFNRWVSVYVIKLFIIIYILKKMGIEVKDIMELVYQAL